MSAISSPVQSVLDLFKGPLANVRFAEVDADGLSRLAADVEAAAADLERQENVLTELRQALAQRQDALLGLAQQALAYARVYADGDEALSEELNRIALPRAPKPKKAGAPKAANTREGREEPSSDTLAESESAATTSGEDNAVAAAVDSTNGAQRRGRKPRNVVAEGAAESPAS